MGNYFLLFESYKVLDLQWINVDQYFRLADFCVLGVSMRFVINVHFGGEFLLALSLGLVAWRLCFGLIKGFVELCIGTINFFVGVLHNYKYMYMS